jgi:hypothetical protein
MQACFGGEHCERFTGACLAGDASLCVEIGLALATMWFEEPDHVDCASYWRAGRMYLHRACMLDASRCNELVTLAKVLERGHAFEERADVLDEACDGGYEPACRLLASRDEGEEKRRGQDGDDAFRCGPSRRARRAQGASTRTE